MQRLLENQVAVVTGAGRGIGRAISLRLAGEGAAVACCDVMLENVQSVAAEITGAGGKATAYAMNVADAGQVNATCDQIVADFGRVDILVNNAGITRDQLLIRMSDEDWDAVLNINLKGPFLCTRSLCRTMTKQRSGKIVNIASTVGITGNAGQANYSASKAGLIGFTKTMARELASRNVRVNAVAPGFIASPMTDKLKPEQKEAIAKQIPLQRMGQPEDVANMVLFLASDLSGYLTGHVVPVDGGLAM